MADEHLTLTGRHVELVPLAPEHADELLAAATIDRATYGFTEVPATTEHMARYVDNLLAKRRAGTDLPFAQRRVADGRLVGCTRYLEIRRWSGGRDQHDERSGGCDQHDDRHGTEPDEVEIGGTWLAADAQRTPLNTEAKLLLLTQAFDVWHVDRVAVATDVRNERSRRAIERLGACFEGVLRHHRLSTVEGEVGRPRDTALYSITDDEWPAVRQDLTDRLYGPT